MEYLGQFTSLLLNAIQIILDPSQVTTKILKFKPYRARHVQTLSQRTSAGLLEIPGSGGGLAKKLMFSVLINVEDEILSISQRLCNQRRSMVYAVRSKTSPYNQGLFGISLEEVPEPHCVKSFGIFLACKESRNKSAGLFLLGNR